MVEPGWAVAGSRAFCRLTVLAPRTSVDVALPADVPVAELVPMLLELVGEPRSGGRRPVPWRLSGAGGGVLPTGATLDELAVPDGELLRLAPAGTAPPPPVFDDPVDAIAAAADEAPPLAGPAGSAALLGVAVVGGGACAAAGPGAAGSAVVAALSAAGALGAAHVLARRPEPGPAAAGTAALIAVPFAAAAGWTALPDPAGGLLLAVAAAGVAATIAQAVVRVVAPALIAVVVAAVLTGVALIGMRLGLPAGAAAAAGSAAALVLAPVLPRTAVRLAGLPRPAGPGDPEPAELPPDELAERAALARGYLGGLTAGCAAVTAAGAAIVGVLDHRWGLAYAGVAVASLALRSRCYADHVPARAALWAALAGAGGLAVIVGSTVLAPVAGLVLAGVCAGGLLVTGRAAAPPGPVTRRVVDLVEGALVVAAVPLALGVMDVYRIVRGL
ncbi:type VII secretion integral membrane protein EccD [Pseudonocardia thermophila]|uniref:type VII secretion integral membrane protein EccD n=1 Tax=Pseudonocardia thermophila TaxID=1848 RepID=UPI00248DF794|nr:type VII secretion integral membrane protein EccD [Pseudonocardia thermophila]